MQDWWKGDKLRAGPIITHEQKDAQIKRSRQIISAHCVWDSLRLS